MTLRGLSAPDGAPLSTLPGMALFLYSAVMALGLFVLWWELLGLIGRLLAWWLTPLVPSGLARINRLLEETHGEGS